ncbi:aspartyl-phosphate phosphatase Spo0E family protein [Paenibacillus donghaensis]|uniref:aspartyl-phosphate phosphatase Spo0E family protein n=1 Tax=Paenibacillus donghaensis TaxID=414771 RepID=UPI001883C97B|nr:aspartyl-phosphate phosphatase Spo0E family protein [Paenibacillus donghaensis]MBE9915226.1 aspartyl-phosphate phosphatase Spo0E family protein [Paenibacillus donghaensis]
MPFYFLCEEPITLIEKIENTRRELIKVVNERKSLTDEVVLKLSQELDIYLLECQKRK